MARQLGAYGFSGKLQDVVGFQRGDGHFVRMAAHGSSRRWHESPRFVRSRENALLFGGASMLACSVYRFLPAPMKKAAGPYAHNKLVAGLTKAGRKAGRVPERFTSGLAAEAMAGVCLGTGGVRTTPAFVGICDLRSAAADQGPGDGGIQVLGDVTPTGGQCPAKGDRVEILIPTRTHADLKPGERMELNIQVCMIAVGSLRRGADGKSYDWETETRLLSFRESGWISAARAGEEARMPVAKPGAVGDGAADAVLVVVSVIYRAVKGGRVRNLHDLATAGIVQPWKAAFYSLGDGGWTPPRPSPEERVKKRYRLMRKDWHGRRNRKAAFARFLSGKADGGAVRITGRHEALEARIQAMVLGKKTQSVSIGRRIEKAVCLKTVESSFGMGVMVAKDVPESESKASEKRVFRGPHMKDRRRSKAGDGKEMAGR